MKIKKIKHQTQSKINLINEIYYDGDWWRKSVAVEWWSNDGHFNDYLYRQYLLAKLNKL
jgi:hypothetical protein